VETVSERRRFL